MVQIRDFAGGNSPSSSVFLQMMRRCRMLLMTSPCSGSPWLEIIPGYGEDHCIFERLSYARRLRSESHEGTKLPPESSIDDYRILVVGNIVVLAFLPEILLNTYGPLLFHLV